MSVKHVDCCFPGLRDMFAVPLSERPQWMLDAVDDDLRRWKSNYTPNAEKVSTFAANKALGEVTSGSTTIAAKKALPKDDQAQHALQNYGNRLYRTFDPDHPDVCEIFLQWCPRKIIGRNCAPLISETDDGRELVVRGTDTEGQTGKTDTEDLHGVVDKKLLNSSDYDNRLPYSWQTVESWQGAKLFQAWFIVARLSPVPDECSPEKKPFGVRFYQSLQPESFDFTTGTRV
ncbi:unnamed protein product, partial [Amoebophrya sp. A25]|eukprot:GSA25T00025222001.1